MEYQTAKIIRAYKRIAEVKKEQPGMKNIKTYLRSKLRINRLHYFINNEIERIIEAGQFTREDILNYLEDEGFYKKPEPAYFG